MFGESLVLKWLLLPLCLSFNFNSLPEGGGVKGWKLSSVLAKKPSSQGWPGDTGKNLLDTRFSPQVIRGPTPQSSWEKQCRRKKGDQCPAGASTVWLASPRRGTSCDPSIATGASASAPLTETMAIIEGNFHAWVPKAACLHSLVGKKRASKVR